MDVQHVIALTLGIGWASGLNLYAAVFFLGALNAAGAVVLPPHLQVLSHPVVLAVSGGMYIIEFCADKVPGFDTVWDGIHTFIRIPAGAILAAQAVGDVHPVATIVAGLLGGGLAAGSHFTKAGTRALVNTVPEPFSNWTLSFAEDGMVFVGLWSALSHPWVFLTFLILAIAIMAAVLPILWKTLRKAWTLFFPARRLSREIETVS